jgi:Kef-type K+ transport system membrane component KefB
MRAVRNIAIIVVLALIVAVVPGGDNAAEAIVTALSILFLALIGLAGWQLYRQYRFTYLQLEDRQRALFLGAVGAIVLMIAGADELTGSGGGLVLWLAVLGASIFAIVRVWTEAQSSY